MHETHLYPWAKKGKLYDNITSHRDEMKARLIRFSLSFVFCCSLAVSGLALAEESPQWETTTLTGDWDGTRTRLSDRGVNMEFTHRSDVISNISGGIKTGTAWLGYTDARVQADLGKLHGWNGLTAYFHFHSILGDKPNANMVGSSMGVDNLETSVNTGQFYQASLEKMLLDNHLSILLGLYPIDSEFYVTDTSGLFIHPSFGMAAELSQAGVNGPAIYPMGALGGRIKYVTADNKAYAQLAVQDGIPGDPKNPYGTQIKLDKSDGIFSIAEFGYTPSLEGVNKTALGVWGYSAHFDDLQDVDAQGNPIKRASVGWYALMERILYAEKQDAAQGLAGFMRMGFANPDIYQFAWSASIGLQYMGLLAGRDLDAAGIAFTSSRASAKYRTINNSAAYESMVEVTYCIQMNAWATAQPFVQRIFNPGMDSSMQDASQLGIRVELTL